jgi:hypothetical protein
MYLGFAKFMRSFMLLSQKKKKVAYIIVYHNTLKAAKPQSTKFCEGK